jgi:nitroreductase
MNLGLSADEVLTTTRAVRKRLDFDRPVDPALIRESLEIALQAPSGSNGQKWRWLVVTDPELRAGMAELYQRAFDRYEGMDANAVNVYKGDDPTRRAQQERVMDSARFLADNMHRVPAMLVPCVPGRFDGMPSIVPTSTLGSVIPAAWSFMLAARNRGLGTAWTTLHLMFEQQAAELLGIPYDEATQVALITIGHTVGTEFKPARREPLDDVLAWDRWRW